MYRKSDVYSFSFNKSQFEEPAVEVAVLADREEDNNLYINIEINVSETDEYLVNVTLTGDSDTISSQQSYDLGWVNNIDIIFNGSEIRESRLGNLTVSLIEIDDYDFNFNYAVGDYDFEAGKSMLADSYSNRTEDLNGNNLFDNLIIDIGLDIKEDGIYTIEAALYDLYDNQIDIVSEEFSLTIGERSRGKV